jgi:CheY-like chemotaxis protein
MQQRVLVIDDDAAVRATIKVILTARGFEVTGADSGPAGLSLLRQSPFDLLIVDVFMPGMDGVNTIKAVHQLNPNMPIIAISGARLRLAGGSPLDMFPLVARPSDGQMPAKAVPPARIAGGVTSLLGIAA